MSNPNGSSNHAKDRHVVGNTTLFIRPVARDLKRDEILSYFSAFGDVKSVRICSKTKRSFGYVSFTLAQSAAKALGVNSHTIGGRRIRIVATSERHQDKTTLLNWNDHRTTFSDLNDDCIHAILLMKSLSARDLCSVAETCRRLKEIAGRAFKRVHKKCDIGSLSGGEAKTAKRILMHFGSEISELEVWGGEQKWSRDILECATEYCSSTLQSLNLQYFKIPANLTTKLRPLFKKLQKLALSYCTFEGASKNLVAECESLVGLEIRDYKNGPAFVFEKTFPNLQHFEYRCILNSDLLASFISRHMNLKSLKFWSTVGSSVLQRVADCRHLEALKCWIPRNQSLDLSNLGHLRELEIHCGGQNVSESALGLKNLKILERQKLNEAKIDSEFIGTLSQQQRLQVLELRRCTGLQNLSLLDGFCELTTLEIQSNESVDLDVVLLVQRLRNLNYLSVQVPRVELDMEKYLEIVDVVRRRPDRSKLTFRLACNEGHQYKNLRDDFVRNAHLVHVIIGRYVLLS